MIRINLPGAGSSPQDQDPSSWVRIHPPGARSTLQNQDPSSRTRVQPPGAGPSPQEPDFHSQLILQGFPAPWLPSSIPAPSNYSAVSQLFPGAAGMRRQQRYCSQGFFPIFYGWDKLLPSPWNSCGSAEPRAGRGSAGSKSSRCCFMIPAPCSSCLWGTDCQDFPNEPFGSCGIG